MNKLQTIADLQAMYDRLRPLARAERPMELRVQSLGGCSQRGWSVSLVESAGNSDWQRIAGGWSTTSLADALEQLERQLVSKARCELETAEDGVRRQRDLLREHEEALTKSSR